MKAVAHHHHSSWDHIVEVTSGPATYAGAAGTIFWGLTADQWTAIGVLIGMTFTGLTFAVNWYYKHRTWKLMRGRES